MSATWPGRLSVGTRVWETPHEAWRDWMRERMKGAGVVLSARTFACGASGSRGTGRGSAEENGGEGYVWKSLSARRPSPALERGQHPSRSTSDASQLTNDEHDAFRERFADLSTRSTILELADAVTVRYVGSDGREEVDVEDRSQVDQVERDAQHQQRRGATEA